MKRRFFIPEVVQTSGMDCGPAAVTSLLRGFGVSADIGAIREACHTGLDGTSVDALEELINEAAPRLLAEQKLVPPEDVFLPEADLLPALLLTRNASGIAHFTIAWRRHGKYIQLMDPARGRRWVPLRDLRQEMLVHEQVVEPGDFAAYAFSDDFQKPLKARLFALVNRHAGKATNTTNTSTGAGSVSVAGAAAQVWSAVTSSQRLGALCDLDAVVRAVDALSASGALPKEKVPGVLLDLLTRVAARVEPDAAADAAAETGKETALPLVGTATADNPLYTAALVPPSDPNADDGPLWFGYGAPSWFLFRRG